MAAGAHLRRRAPRWIAVAMLCVLAQVLGLLHMGLVGHQRCAEHGELIHVDADAPAPAPGGAFDEDPAVGVAAFLAHQRLPEHGHDHCQVPVERPAPDAPTVDSVPLAAAGTAPSAPADVPFASREPLFRLAPKASPPVVG